MSGGWPERYNAAFVAEFVKVFGDTPDCDAEQASIAEHFWEMGYEHAAKEQPTKEAEPGGAHGSKDA